MSETRTTFKERQLRKKQIKVLAAEAAAQLGKKSLSTAERELRDAKRYANGVYVEKYIPDTTEDEFRGLRIARKDPRARERWDREGRADRMREEQELALLPVVVAITLPFGSPPVAATTLLALKFKFDDTEKCWVGKAVLATAQAIASQYGGEAKLFNAADPVSPISIAAE